MMKMYFIILSFLLLVGCGSKKEERSAMSSAFERNAPSVQGEYDLDDVRRGGELIVATLSGPDTYYEYHGMPMGMQYALVENFAEGEGLKVRVELASDTTALLSMLEKGEVDIIAFPLPLSLLKDKKYQAAGAFDKNKQTSWLVRSTANELGKALNAWFADGVEVNVRKLEATRIKMRRQINRRAQAVYLSRTRGIISIYDELFKQAAATIGWDWRLLAAQCYQESAFDPNAKSWADAQGLMQLMPATARELGVTPQDVNHPETNVMAGVRYLRKLILNFEDVRDSNERIKFVLAAYNGGAFHIRDAMALARKYGKNPHSWNDVSVYILGLQSSRYYRDPVVKYGYMIGSETAGYVKSIIERWQGYGGNVALVGMPSPLPPASTASSKDLQDNNMRPVKKNKYSSGVRIMSPDDPEFHQMKP